MRMVRFEPELKLVLSFNFSLIYYSFFIKKKKSNLASMRIQIRLFDSNKMKPYLTNKNLVTKNLMGPFVKRVMQRDAQKVSKSLCFSSF